MPAIDTLSSELMAALALLDPARMMEHTRRLCAPAFTGRRVGTEGHHQATRYLLETLQAFGWKPRTHAFPIATPVLELEAPLVLEHMTLAESVARVFAHRTEFCEHPRSASHPGLLEGQIMVLPEDGLLNVCQGKWVLLEVVPQGEDLTVLAAQLAEHGALGLLTPLYATAEGYLVKRIVSAPVVALPILSVRTDLLSTLVGTRIRARVPLVARQVQGVNVLAECAGTDDHFAHAPLVIGAHYDALGDDLGGHHFPGATDNAAAVAVMLELARALSLLETPPRRPLMVVAFDAEEVGALGSRSLASDLKEQGKAPLMLNLDGAACLNEAVWVEPGTGTESLVQALDQAGRWLDIPLVVGTIASDQRSFLQAGFPAVGLSVGCAKIHTPADALDLVEPEALRVAATLLLGAIWQVLW
ncbi:M28 family metallopeptidase [Ktedonospora formicarum]|uniref:Peptidase M28 domain-containing protein n=1 Tax=Ktedonospora formicarum TaxID=2778364 RepID=A0A8J3I7A8_9CHLR|nr:M20/M25/M40 family metallo-hydrolase [Ktedonospora formicarum]GHO48766.1 hypothetical protein KSX_69290 [Ktedonospora formicarum]